MQFNVYPIQNRRLRPLVKYILFNTSQDHSPRTKVISYANYNICLGIVRGRQLVRAESGEISTLPTGSITSYISGMYLSPHCFVNEGTFDEICIDFSPMGYYQFTHLPVQTYLLDGNPLLDLFGRDALPFFEEIFSIRDHQQRGVRIEDFLLRNIRSVEKPFLSEALAIVHHNPAGANLDVLIRQLKCSESKLLRAFRSHFDLTPKEYIRIVRFRRSLHSLNKRDSSPLTDLAYRCGYYDQSHFIKEYQFFTGSSPKRIRGQLVDVQQEVLISVDQ